MLNCNYALQISHQKVAPFFILKHTDVLQFEDMKVRFQLVSMSVSIKESKEKPEIIKLSVIDLRTMLTQRSSAQAIM